jgi:hypothetical protein
MQMRPDPNLPGDNCRCDNKRVMPALVAGIHVFGRGK